MINWIILILLSFFAVIGMVECVLSVLEAFSTYKYECVEKSCLVVTLSNTETGLFFLLHTLLLYAQKISFRNTTTQVVLIIDELSPAAKNMVQKFCKKSRNIRIENNGEV